MWTSWRTGAGDWSCCDRDVAFIKSFQLYEAKISFNNICNYQLSSVERRGKLELRLNKGGSWGSIKVAIVQWKTISRVSSMAIICLLGFISSVSSMVINCLLGFILVEDYQ